MCFDMLFQVLRTFELLATECTAMRLQRHVNSNMRRYMIALLQGDVAIAPPTGQVEVVGALAANVLLANMILR